MNSFVVIYDVSSLFFFFQAEDGIRDYKVTGVQTCALPICLARLPSVAGVSWKAAEASGEKGERTPHAVDFENSAVSLRIYSRYRLSPALLWHLHLLGQLLGEFYMAKLREEQLRQASYVQAVHET